MASTGQLSQLQSPPETPESKGHKEQTNERSQAHAPEDQAHITPEGVETGEEMPETNRPDDALVDEDDEDNDVESIHRIPSLQHTPIHPHQHPSFPSSTGYASPPSSQPSSAQASRRRRGKAQGKTGRGQMMQQQEEQPYEPYEAPNSYNSVSNLPLRSRPVRGKNEIAPRAPMNSVMQSGAMHLPVGDYAPHKAETKGDNASLRVKLDLNLEVEIMLKARVKGDLTLALFN